MSSIIRIYRECEGRIEKSFAGACRVMTNGDPEGKIFLSYPHRKNGFFFLLTTVFLYFKIRVQKSLNTLRCNSMTSLDDHVHESNTTNVCSPHVTAWV